LAEAIMMKKFMGFALGFVILNISCGESHHDTQHPNGSTTANSVIETDGKWIKSLCGIRLGSKYLSPPSKEDETYASKLSPEISQIGFSYLGKTSRQHYTLTHARPICEFLLLCYSCTTEPSLNRFLVYSVNNKEIVGKFVWYVQY